MRKAALGCLVVLALAFVYSPATAGKNKALEGTWKLESITYSTGVKSPADRNYNIVVTFTGKTYAWDLTMGKGQYHFEGTYKVSGRKLKMKDSERGKVEVRKLRFLDRAKRRMSLEDKDSTMFFRRR